MTLKSTIAMNKRSHHHSLRSLAYDYSRRCCGVGVHVGHNATGSVTVTYRAQFDERRITAGTHHKKTMMLSPRALGCHTTYYCTMVPTVRARTSARHHTQTYKFRKPSETTATILHAPHPKLISLNDFGFIC